MTTRFRKDREPCGYGYLNHAERVIANFVCVLAHISLFSTAQDMSFTYSLP